MARVIALFAVFAALFAQIFAVDISEEDGVLVLTEKNFDEAVAQYSPLLVEFYAPWCGHCKKLAPEYAAAAKTLSADNLKLAKVDCTIEESLAKRFAIQGFPTLKFFRGSAENPQEYNGGRTANEIVTWVQKKSGPSAKPIASKAAAEAIVANQNVVILGYFSDAESTAAKNFRSVADSIDDVTFGVISDAAVAAEFGVSDNTVFSINNFKKQDNKVVAESASTVGEITDFVNTNAVPLVIHFSPETAPKIFRGKIKNHLLVFIDTTTDDSEAHVDSLREVAKALPGKAMYVVVDPKQERIVSYFGVQKEDFPTAVFVSMPDDSAMKKFSFDKSNGFSAEALINFVNAFFENKLKPFLKSAEIPNADEEAKAPVKSIVGKNFDERVINSDVNTLVMFYAPWCGHCKNLMPIYEELATELADQKNLVIAKIDATENEVDFDGVNVRGFPTIYFFKNTANGSKPKTLVEYDGDRSIDGFKNFLDKHNILSSAGRDEL